MVTRAIRSGFGSRLFDLFNAGFLIFLVFITLYPFYYVVIVSISDGVAIINGEVKFWPVGINLASYRLIFSSGDIPIALRNSVFYTVSGTLISLALTTLCAYPLSRRRMVFGGAIMGIIVFTMFFDGGIIPTYLLIQRLGMLDTVWAIIIPQAIGAWYMIIMRTFFMSLPDSLEESAYIDGANDFTILLRIILPLSTAILATLTVFYAVFHWNSFFPALIYLTRERLYPLQIILRNVVILGQISEQTNDMGASTDFLSVEKTIQYSVIMVSTLPIIVVYPFLQRYFVKGVMIGSLKG